MKTIGIYHTKGGVGKSAVTVFLADFLSSLYDKRVLVVDLDPQNNASGGLIGAEALDKSFKAGHSLPALWEQTAQGPQPPNKETVQGHLIKRDAIPSRGRTRYLAEVSVLAGSRKDWNDWQDWLADIPRDRHDNYLDLLADCLKPLGDEYDICLVDFPDRNIERWRRLGCGVSAGGCYRTNRTGSQAVILKCHSGSCTKPKSIARTGSVRWGRS